MPFALGPQAAAAGYRLIAYDTIGSTSTKALDRARAGEPGRLWIVSDHQTAGHGRRGRAWETAKGNLAASLLLDLPPDLANPAALGFVAGLTLQMALGTVLGGSGQGVAVTLKWPNDVLLDGAKVAGILLQAANRPDGASSIVIGMGVNVVAAPQDLPYPATSLAEEGCTADAPALFTALTEAWTKMHALWDDGRGFPAIRRRWLAVAAGLGAPISVRSDDTVLTGLFDTIDDSGMLVLRGEGGGLRRIAAGDVHFGAVATARQ